jgi:hypothetical protein
VPHCDTCDRFYNPNTLKPDGTCPTCGRQLGEKLTRFETEGAPWHFKLLIAVTVVYLGWRLIQLIFWIFS